ncbi:MAG: hypothetical protein HKN23_05995, partial [Verrucomicrobiales bacterium]|nr:hypothetical protein [Verrucomicrobiales bacterium]
MKRPLSLVICLLVPVVILLVGVIFAGVYGAAEFPKLARESGRGLVKPGFTATLDEPGKYTVWLHTYSVIDGTA